jgi:hypothetical protein
MGRRIHAPNERGGGTGGRSERPNARAPGSRKICAEESAKVSEELAGRNSVKATAQAAQHWLC